MGLESSRTVISRRLDTDAGSEGRPSSRGSMGRRGSQEESLRAAVSKVPWNRGVEGSGLCQEGCGWGLTAQRGAPAPSQRQQMRALCPSLTLGSVAIMGFAKMVGLLVVGCPL